MVTFTRFIVLPPFFFDFLHNFYDAFLPALVAGFFRFSQSESAKPSIADIPVVFAFLLGHSPIRPLSSSVFRFLFLYYF